MGRGMGCLVIYKKSWGKRMSTMQSYDDVGKKKNFEIRKQYETI